MTPTTIISILINGAVGIMVGLVTKYAGNVKKGFAMIFRLLLSGVLQAIMMADVFYFMMKNYNNAIRVS
jgi:UDP-sugar transporter A1/2/3